MRKRNTRVKNLGINELTDWERELLGLGTSLDRNRKMMKRIPVAQSSKKSAKRNGVKNGAVVGNKSRRAIRKALHQK